MATCRTGPTDRGRHWMDIEKVIEVTSMDHNYCIPGYKDLSEQQDHTGLGIISKMKEYTVLLTLPENIEVVREQGTTSSATGRVVREIEMCGLSRKIEPNFEDLVNNCKQAEEHVKRLGVEATFKEFSHSPPYAEGFKSEGESLNEEFVSDGHLDERESYSVKQSAAPVICVVSPQIVRNRINITTGCDNENFVSPPQQFDELVKIEESEATSAEVVSSLHFSDIASAQSEDTSESLANDNTQGSTMRMEPGPSAIDEHGRILPYACSFCGNVFKTDAAMTSHITRLHPGNSDVCAKAFFKKRPSFKKLHLNKHELSYREKCDVCGKKFVCLPMHMLTHTGERPHNCGTCGKVFIATGNSDRGSIDLISANSKGPYYCHICEKELKITCRHFTLHMKKHTLTEPHLTCVCSATHGSSDDTQNLVTSTKQRSHKCVLCGKLFHQKIDLSMHIRNHAEQNGQNTASSERGLAANNPNQCSGEDNQTCVDKDSVPEKPGKCVVCGKYIKTKGYMKTHLLTHTGELPFKCDLCELLFRYKGSLSKHMLFHQKIDLSMHMRNHGEQYGQNSASCEKGLAANNPNQCSGEDNQTCVDKDSVPEKPGKCVVCRKYIKTKGYMKTHLLTHTGELPLKCDLCELLFRHKGSLSKHMLTHAEYQPPHKCNKCGKRFAQRAHLREHNSREHNSLIHPMTNGNVSNNLSPDIFCGQGLVHNDEPNQIPMNWNRHYKCVSCGKEFGRHSVLMRHLEIHTKNQQVKKPRSVKNEPIDKTFGNCRHIEEEGKVNNDQNLCSFCDHGFHSRLELHLHLLTHFKGRLHDCDACVQGFTSEELLLKHLINHIESSMYDSCAYVVGVQQTQSLMSDKENGTIVGNVIKNQYLSQGTAEDSRNEQPRNRDVREKSVKTKRNISRHMLTRTVDRPHKCNVCRKGFKQKGHLRKHILTHSVKRPHECHVCGKAFRQMVHLREHMFTHNGKFPHNCSVCGKGFAKKANLSLHMLIHTGELPHKCGVCRRRFRAKYQLTRHMFTHTGEWLYKCNVCGKGFARKGGLADHMSIHTGERPHRCRVCGKGFTHKAKLTGHMFIHTGKLPHTCCVCGKGFIKKVNLTDHMFTHTGEWPHKCHVCERGFTRKINLKEHMFIHTGKFLTKPNKCGVCGKRFTRKIFLSRHMVTHAGEWPYKCGVCGNGFTERTYLTKHMYIHLEKFPHKCGVCGMGFTKNSRLTNHMFTHTGKFPHKCHVCGKGFIWKSILSHHLWTHATQPHKCSVCAKGFAHKCHLNEHMFTHTGEWPHRCGVCGKGLANKSQLTAHMFTHAEERLYKCGVCGKGFLKKAQLAPHMVVHQCGVLGKGYTTEKTDLTRHILSPTGEWQHRCVLCGNRFTNRSQLQVHMFVHRGEQTHKCGECGKRFIIRSQLTAHMYTHTTRF